MRILTNYFQILTLASDYNLSWQGSLSEFLYVISFLSKADQLIISQDCLIRESVKNLHPLFVKMAIAFFFPFVGIVAIVILWSLARLFKKNLEYKNYIVQSITIFVFVCIPPITTLTFEIFNCQDIFNNGQKYLIVDLDIQCWVGDHNLYAKLFGIPCLIIWVIGVPFFTFFMLYKKKT